MAGIQTNNQDLSDSLCILCSNQKVSLGESENEVENNIFAKFCAEIFPDFIKTTRKYRMNGKLSWMILCEECEEYVEETVEVKGKVREVEENVRRLQSEVLTALKNLSKILGDYFDKLKSVEAVIQKADGNRVPFLSVLMKEIITETNNLKSHQDNLSTKLLEDRVKYQVEPVVVKVETQLEDSDHAEMEDDNDMFIPNVKSESLEDSESEDWVPFPPPVKKARKTVPKETPEIQKIIYVLPPKRRCKSDTSPKPKKRQLNYKEFPSRQILYCNLCPNFKVRSIYALEFHLRSHEIPEKSLKCGTCPEKFSNEQYYQIHLQTHQGMYQRICDICPSHTSINAPDHLKHLKSHGDNIPILHCPNCSFVCSLRKTFVKHLTNHSGGLNGGGQFPCDICSQQHSTNVQLIRHLKDKHGENTEIYCCGICSKSFPSASGLTAHKRTRHGKGYRCKECDKAFPTQLKFLKHRKDVHDGGFPCTQCTERFCHQTTLETHLVNEHNSPKFKCDQCDKAFSSRNWLKMHQKTHETGGGFSCEYCGKSCETRQMLKAHRTVHSKERNFTCDKCGMSFKSKDNLKKHMPKHDDNRKRFFCELCQKSFTRHENLKVHLRIHRGERPYVCDLCGKDFNQSGAFNSHKKTVHQVTTNE